MKLFFTLLIMIFGLSFGGSAQSKLTHLWTADEKLPTPESVLYVSSSNELLVSLIDGDGSEKDGNGGVAKLNPDGTLKDPVWVEGLNAPKGMALHGELLYIADIDEVVIIEYPTGKTKNVVGVPGAVFLNDVAAGPDGKIYVSDTRNGEIYVLEDEQPSLYMEDVPNVNGLRVIDGTLYALAGRELWKIGPTKEKEVITADIELDADGLEPVGDGSFLVTCWPGQIYHITADGQVSKLLDVQGKMNTADLGYNPKERILYIPTFLKNSVVAYRLD